MVPLEKINQLKNQGKSDQEIIGMLQEQGHKPKEITDAFNQLRIKTAVNPGQQMNQGMSPSIMSDEGGTGNSTIPTPSNYQQQNQTYTPQPSQGQQNYPSQNQQQYSQDQYYPPQSQQYQNYGNQEAYQPQIPQDQDLNNQGYYEEDSYSPQAQEYSEYEGYAQPYESTDTIIEIAEQVFSEKSKELENSLKEAIEFKRIYEQKIIEMDERLKRIERYFDKMQLAIMEKVTSFGKNIQNLQNEINMVEDSFSKVVNPLTDKHSKDNSANTPHKRTSHKK